MSTRKEMLNGLVSLAVEADSVIQGFADDTVDLDWHGSLKMKHVSNTVDECFQFLANRDMATFTQFAFCQGVDAFIKSYCTA